MKIVHFGVSSLLLFAMEIIVIVICDFIGCGNDSVICNTKSIRSVENEKKNCSAQRRKIYGVMNERVVRMNEVLQSGTIEQRYTTRAVVECAVFDRLVEVQTVRHKNSFLYALHTLHSFKN